MALCPFAVKKLIPAGENDPHLDEVYGAILHVAVTNNDTLFPYFNGPSGGIESHFYIDLDGGLEQYRDTSWEADANYQANSFAVGGKRAGFVSIETAGMGPGTWNAAQLRTIRRLLSWLAKVHDFPLSVCGGPFKRGVGYHTMWGAPSQWTPVSKDCPGPARVQQFKNDLVPWMRQESHPKPKPDPKPAPSPAVLKATRVSVVRESIEVSLDKLADAQADAGGANRDKRVAQLRLARRALREALDALPER